MAKKKAEPEAEMPLRLAWMSPEELAENPRNWRIHPDSQISALTGVLSEVGWAGACLLNERTGHLIDGHARRKVALEQGGKKVPVLVGSWDEAQERKILATLDPLAALAGADSEKLDALLADVQTDDPAVQALLDSLAAKSEPEPDEQSPAPAAELKDVFSVLVECETEQQQAELLERLTLEGLRCRSLIA